MSDYAYGRVSSKDQNLDRQLEAFKKINIPLKNIYMDKQSGADFKRKNYQKLMKKLRAGDVLYIKSIDRLGRNYSEILEQWKFLANEKMIDIVVLDMPLLDTRNSKDLIGTFLSDVVLQILSFVAENERNNSKIRQAEGIAVAKKKGVVFGRPRVMRQHDFNKAYYLLQDEGYCHREMISKMQLSSSTFYRYFSCLRLDPKNKIFKNGQ